MKVVGNTAMLSELRQFLLLDSATRTLLLIPLFFSVVIFVVACARLLWFGLIQVEFELFYQTKIRILWEEVILPEIALLQPTVLLLIADIITLSIGAVDSKFDLDNVIEIPFGLAAAAGVIALGSRIADRFLDKYLLDAIRKERKLNRELLGLAKTAVKALFIFIVVVIFFSVRHVNITAFITGLGAFGFVIAFVARSLLEQVLGAVVIYLDKPFGIDDYIRLPDGTFGRVEAIGWRSTKIRSSGQGTLMVVPNSNLLGLNIENYMGSKRLMVLGKLEFFECLSDVKKAYIRQITHGSLIFDKVRKIRVIRKSQSRIKSLKEPGIVQGPSFG